MWNTGNNNYLWFTVLTICWSPARLSFQPPHVGCPWKYPRTSAIFLSLSISTNATILPCPNTPPPPPFLGSTVYPRTSSIFVFVERKQMQTPRHRLLQNKTGPQTRSRPWLVGIGREELSSILFVEDNNCISEPPVVSQGLSSSGLAQKVMWFSRFWNCKIISLQPKHQPLSRSPAPSSLLLSQGWTLWVYCLVHKGTFITAHCR